mmetsp:Transcript_37738/g.88207  ORF Transcript_37738/g.88207 Transcript_37738/m.88207 type:complete len:218 (-) Transcript_37738:277-930(-)
MRGVVSPGGDRVSGATGAVAVLFSSSAVFFPPPPSPCAVASPETPSASECLKSNVFNIHKARADSEALASTSEISSSNCFKDSAFCCTNNCIECSILRCVFSSSAPCFCSSSAISVLDSPSLFLRRPAFFCSLDSRCVFAASSLAKSSARASNSDLRTSTWSCRLAISARPTGGLMSTVSFSAPDSISNPSTRVERALSAASSASNLLSNFSIDSNA